MSKKKKTTKERLEDVKEDLADDGKRNYSHDPERKSPGRKKGSGKKKEEKSDSEYHDKPCPDCGETKLKWTGGGGKSGKDYHCKACGLNLCW